MAAWTGGVQPRSDSGLRRRRQRSLHRKAGRKRQGSPDRRGGRRAGRKRRRPPHHLRPGSIRPARQPLRLNGRRRHGNRARKAGPRLRYCLHQRVDRAPGDNGVQRSRALRNGTDRLIRGATQARRSQGSPYRRAHRLRARRGLAPLHVGASRRAYDRWRTGPVC